MQELKRVIWRLAHIVRCPDKHLEPTYKTLTKRCDKCGRETTIF